MKPELLDELEVSAALHGVRVALQSAYIAGRADALHEAFLDITTVPEEYTIMDKIRDEAANE